MKIATELGNLQFNPRSFVVSKNYFLENLRPSFLRSTKGVDSGGY